MLNNPEIELLKLFNDKASKIINSKFKKESLEKKLGETISWNEKDGMTYTVSNHDDDFINSVLMPLRLLFQNNDEISINNISKLYENMEIGKEYKIVFKKIRGELNEFLDEQAKTLLDDKPTRRELFETILYGEIAHVQKEKRNKLETWKSDKMIWDLAYMEFQRLIHEIIFSINLISNLNKRIMKYYGVVN